MTRTDLEQALSAELTERAPAFDQASDYEDLQRRLAEARSLVLLDGPASNERRRWTRPLGAVAAAAVLVGAIGALVGVVRSDEAAVEVATAAVADEPRYYWPTALPDGWSLIEAGSVEPSAPIQDYGLVAASASGGRLVAVEVTLDEGPNQRRPQVPQFTEDVDGMEVGVIYVDDQDAVVEWTADGYRFHLWGRLIHLPEVFHLAAGTTATRDSSGVITDVVVPLGDDFDIIVDRQPASDPTSPSLVFRFDCPGEDCGHTVTIGPLPYDSVAFARAEFTSDGTVTHRSEHGEILIDTEPIGGDRLIRAMTVLGDGDQLTVQPDTGPIRADPHGQGAGLAPLTVSDVDTIVAGLVSVSPDGFDDLVLDLE